MIATPNLSGQCYHLRLLSNRSFDFRSCILGSYEHQGLSSWTEGVHTFGNCYMATGNSPHGTSLQLPPLEPICRNASLISSGSSLPSWRPPYPPAAQYGSRLGLGPLSRTLCWNSAWGSPRSVRSEIIFVADPKSRISCWTESFFPLEIWKYYLRAASPTALSLVAGNDAQGSPPCSSTHKPRLRGQILGSQVDHAVRRLGSLLS